MFSDIMGDKIPYNGNWNFELVEREPEKYFVEIEWLHPGNEFIATGSAYRGKYVLDHEEIFPRFVCTSKNSELVLLESEGQVKQI